MNPRLIEEAGVARRPSSSGQGTFHRDERLTTGSGVTEICPYRRTPPRQLLSCPALQPKPISERGRAMSWAMQCRLWRRRARPTSNPRPLAGRRWTGMPRARSRIGDRRRGPHIGVGWDCSIGQRNRPSNDAIATEPDADAFANRRIYRRCVRRRRVHPRGMRRRR